MHQNMKLKSILILVLLPLAARLTAASQNDSILLNEFNSIPENTFSYAFIYLGDKDTNGNNIIVQVGYDSSNIGKKVIRKELILGNSPKDTLFRFVDTVKSNLIMQNIIAIFGKLPVFHIDTSYSTQIKDTCFGKGFLFSMNSNIGGIQRVYQNCCQKCSIELLNTIEQKHIFKFTRSELIKKAFKFKSKESRN